MDFPLLETKVHVPCRMAGQVERPRLRELLNQLMEPGRSVLLLSAPAGFGKSTLIADWLAGSASMAPRVAWLSLDPEDNDPARFWNYLIFALRKIDPAFGAAALQALQEPPMPLVSGGPSLRSALTLILNELAAVAGPIVIVLDDFHRLTSPEIHADLSYALERWSESARLVLSTRVDPPLAMARLRATGRLLEIRAGELRFTQEESERFLSSAISLELDAQQVRLVSESADGWIAGLKMAALAMGKARDAQLVVREMSRGKGHIMDYLAEEVLEQQEPAIQDFLLRTGTLDRFSAPLADAVSGAGDGSPADSQSLLEEVRHRNLFLVPMDDESTWFRYHALFADLLRARLERLHPELSREIHRHASTWFESHGMWDDAFKHALACGEVSGAAELIVAHSRTLIWSGWAGTVNRWLTAIPEQRFKADLRLVVSRAWTRCFVNQWDSMRDDLQMIDAMVAAGTAATPLQELQRENAQITAAILRAYLAYHEGDPKTSLVLARKACALAAASPPALRGASLAILGFALKASGELAEARQVFETSGPLFLAERNLTAWATGALLLTDILVVQGLLPEARQHNAEALHVLEERAAAHLPPASYIYLAAADLAWMQGDHRTAERWLEKAQEQAPSTGDAEVIQRVALARARGRASDGRVDESLVLLDALDAELPARRSLPKRQALEALRVACWTAAGKLDEVAKWLDSTPDPGTQAFSAEALQSVRIRAMANLGRLAQAQEECERSLELARSAGRLSRVVAFLALRARILWQAGNREASLTSLQEALQAASAGSIVQPFLDNGAALREPLSEIAVRLGAGAAAPGSKRAEAQALLRKVLDALGPQPSAAPGVAPATPPSEAPVEPLTDREREVLSLVAAGYSNQQIAERLFVSVATVKKHVSAVLAKLGAASRTRAVAIGRSSGLI